MRKLYIQFPYRWAESYFQLLFLFEANECRLKRCWFHLNKRPQHLRINWQVCPLQDWNRKHNLNIHTPQWAEWISKLLIRPTYFSSSLSCGGLRAWTRASSLLNVKWCNLLSGGVDKLVFSVTVMFPISHDLRRSLFPMFVSLLRHQSGGVILKTNIHRKHFSNCFCCPSVVSGFHQVCPSTRTLKPVVPSKINEWKSVKDDLFCWAIIKTVFIWEIFPSIWCRQWVWLPSLRSALEDSLFSVQKH